jgi:two-component system, LytTR family, sensor kinase
VNGRRLLSPSGRHALVVSVWVLAVVIAASQWRLYDATHEHPERFTYYLVTCAYLGGVLTPAVLWSGRRWSIDSRTWKRALPIHVAASILLAGLGVFIEGAIGWLPHAGQWPLRSALRHYFTQHTQISVLTYWVLLGALHIYRMYDRARLRELHAAQLESQLREAQLMALRSQLQPHFLFNTLQAAMMLIYEDPKGAEEILLSLSELLRLSLQAFQQKETPLRNEIEFLQHYAAIQQRRFRDRLRFEFQIEEQCNACAVPTLFLQPLLENAVQHGIGVRKQSDVISVRAVRNRDRLDIEIENQVSVLNGALETLLSRGVGLANTIARLQRLYAFQHSFGIRNLSPQGVSVLISIPVRLLPARTEELEFQAVS